MNLFFKFLNNKIFISILISILTIFNFSTNTYAANEDFSSITTNTLLTFHNQYRLQNKLSKLTYNPLLASSAQKKANDMLETNCWSHYCPDNTSPWTYFADSGYEYIHAGENLAEGFYDAHALMDAWINSSSHRANILNSNYTQVGFGIAIGEYQGSKNNIIIVVHFANPKEETNIISEFGEVTLNNPISNSTYYTDSINVSGVANGFSNLDVFINNTYKTTVSVNEGFFDTPITNLPAGINNIYFAGIINGSLTKSNVTNFEIKTNKDQKNLTEIQSSFFVISNSQKQVVNLLFIFVIGFIFVIDVWYLAKNSKNFSLKTSKHFHFSVLFILAINILVGSLSSEIASGINI